MALDSMGKEPGMGMMDMGDDESPESESGPMDEFETEARAAFPDEQWTPERVMAFKEAIRLCLEKDEAGGYDEKPPAKGSGEGLALIFGGPKKKAG